MDSIQNRLIILLLLYGLTFAGAHTATRLRQTQRRQPNWSAVPFAFEGWDGKQAVFDPLYGIDPADTSLLRMYSQYGQPPVIVYVGFYNDLSTILDVHTPEVCYPAQGWMISEVRRSPGGLFRGQPIRGKEIVVYKSEMKRLVGWWYNAGSRPFETRIRYVYAMLALSMFTGRADGSMVRIETPIDAGGENAASARIEAFRESLTPALERALP